MKSDMLIHRMVDIKMSSFSFTSFDEESEDLDSYPVFFFSFLYVFGKVIKLFKL